MINQIEPWISNEVFKKVLKRKYLTENRETAFLKIT